MRKKLGTRFPASRIKKIMQADEDVGKIALAVPLLVSKALELFLQDLCDRTYEVTLQRGAKTLNSLHLKQCVKMYSAFDFLTDVVNKVPNLGGQEPCGDDKGISRRRKTLLHDGDAEANEELRSTKMA
ncbi:dr1-associated corepressor-like isoform X1 [Iris pallida]|nr:dr1-associated corepressor-like isoform X1 [Iris pallida]